MKITKPCQQCAQPVTMTLADFTGETDAQSIASRAYRLARAVRRMIEVARDCALPTRTGGGTACLPGAAKESFNDNYF